MKTRGYKLKNLLKKILKYLFSPIFKKLDNLQNQIEENRIILAKLLLNDNQHRQIDNTKLPDLNLKVFSQWNEDGIIQYLLTKVPIENDVFVEFGVQDYSESNTRFLLVNNNWRGLVIDSNADYIKCIKDREIYWKYELKAIRAFITKDNINNLIQLNGITGDIGLLSIDVDGNDYWIWEAIKIISPRIVICEYNSVFGNKEPITIPYNENFYRTKAHYSNLYFGASLKALCLLGEKKGYIFVGSNNAGSNAFFVRKDVSKELIPLNHNEGYVQSRVRESRDKKGQLNCISGAERIKLISEMKVVNVKTKEKKTISMIDT